MRGTGPRAAAVTVWLLTRAVLLLCVFGALTLSGPDVTSDIRVIYAGWADLLGDGSFPHDDVTWQYPPLAALPVLAPTLLPWSYPTGFFLLACATDAGVLALLWRAAARPGASPAGVWVWIAGLPLLGPTAYARYDVMVTALVVGALLLAVRHPRTAGVLCGLGAMTKVWPALLLVGLARDSRGRRLLVGTLCTAVGTLALCLLAAPGSLNFLFAQRDRGTEVESLGAMVFHLWRWFGWEGRVELHYGSMEFLGPHVPLVSTLALALNLAAFGWLLLWRLRATRNGWLSDLGDGTLWADAAFVAVLLFTTTSRVISPQYLLWLVGVGAVCLTRRGSRQQGPVLLVLPACGLTLLEFPLGFAHVVASDGWGVTLLGLRNGLLVAACVWGGLRLWRAPTPRRPAPTAPPARTAPGQRSARRGRHRAGGGPSHQAPQPSSSRR
ncbi:glycosyltransferase family 87 protein [Streptomyces sp. NPDC005438]|uniref:glycosyltransferase family 87 protein n=1 Tax=Streptomyces sp. NPDC005438 TaxID=3156880 RepID=UPI0033AB1319